MKKLIFILTLLCANLAFSQMPEQIELAHQGDTTAQNTLGAMYLEQYYDDDNPNTLNNAIQWFTKAAKQGNTEAMYNLGVTYIDDTTINESSERGLMLIQKAADNNNANAVYYLALQAQENSNTGHSEQLLTKAAQLGHIDATQELSDKLFQKGDIESLKAAIRWYKIAAESGSARAMAILGKIYYYGKGVEKSYLLAKKWFTQAYQEEHSHGAVGLADLYRLGQGVTQSDKKAQTLYTEAIEMNESNIAALYHLAQYAIQKKNTEETIRIIEQLEQTIRQSGSEKNTIAGAQTNMILARMFEYGEYVKQSFDNAVFYYSDAVIGLPDEAYRKIATLYADNKSEKDYISVAELVCTSHWLSKPDKTQMANIRDAFEARFEKDLGAQAVIKAKNNTTSEYCFSNDITSFDIINTPEF